MCLLDMEITDGPQGKVLMAAFVTVRPAADSLLQTVVNV
jgi:hypothetical protein